jgi:hypothetical protein
MKKAKSHKNVKQPSPRLRAESERAELELIRRRLALPIEKRLNSCA